MATREKKEAARLKGMTAAEKAAAEQAAEKARAAEAARAAKAAAAAEAELRRPARQAQVLAEWKASAAISPISPYISPISPLHLPGARGVEGLRGDRLVLRRGRASLVQARRVRVRARARPPVTHLP